MNMPFNKSSSRCSLRYALFARLVGSVRHQSKTKKFVMHTLFLMNALVSENVIARGWHSNSDAPDWLIIWVLGFVAIFLLLLSAAHAFKYWKEGAYLKSIIVLVICAALSWFLISWIEWSKVWWTLASIGAIGGSLFAVGASLFIVGFVLKVIFGIFFKDARNVSTGDFIEGVASLVGLVLAMVVPFLVFAAIFIGLPVIIIIQLFA